jgi:fumarate reductase (CoM/CoB) subunit A
MNVITTDVLIVGAGGAAARAAVEAVASGGLRVDLVDKGKFGESGTSSTSLWGIAVLTNKEDKPEFFFKDWILSGGYISEQNLAWEAVIQSQKVPEWLEAIGLEFLRNPDGSRQVYKGAGHSIGRGLTSKAANIVALLRAEAERRGVHIHEGIMITKLLKEDGHVIGAIGVSQNGDFFVFNAKAVVLAAGGANRLYPYIDRDIADPKYRTTGDAFSLAFVAGASIIDMEFINFRDCPPGGARFGGKYVNSLGERFMERYDPKALEKAPRAKMVEALYREVKAGRGPIIWDVEGIRKEEREMSVVKRFAGRKQVEVTIDFQRLLGGARINERAETDVSGLFAAGESAGGVHGAGRMQGTSFLETQVLGANAGGNAAALALNTERIDFDTAEVNEEKAKIDRSSGNIDPAEVTKSVQKIMWENVGIVRDGAGLRDAAAKFEKIRKETIPRLMGDVFARLEIANLVLTAEMVTKAALAREETRGMHIRDDYPMANDNKWRVHVCIKNKKGNMDITTLPIQTMKGKMCCA